MPLLVARLPTIPSSMIASGRTPLSTMPPYKSTFCKTISYISTGQHRKK